jgi:hypothetical protein
MKGNDGAPSRFSNKVDGEEVEKEQIFICIK